MYIYIYTYPYTYIYIYMYRSMGITEKKMATTSLGLQGLGCWVKGLQGLWVGALGVSPKP